MYLKLLTNPFESLFGFTTKTEKNKVVLNYNAAGFSKEDLEISVEEDSRILEVLASSDKEDTYSYRVYVPNHYDLERLNAKYKNGLLTIELPLKERKTRKISVE